MNDKFLIGKIIRYDRTRYVKVIRFCRVKRTDIVITKTGRRLARPTEHGVVALQPSYDKDGFNWNGDEIRIPLREIEAYRHYGKDHEYHINDGSIGKTISLSKNQ